MRKFFSERRQKDPYAVAYFMMHDIQTVARHHMKTFLDHVVWTDNKQTKMHIDIDSWLTSLPQPIRHDVIDIIRKYAKDLNQLKGKKNYFDVIQ